MLVCFRCVDFRCFSFSGHIRLQMIVRSRGFKTPSVVISHLNAFIVSRVDQRPRCIQSALSCTRGFKCLSTGHIEWPKTAAAWDDSGFPFAPPC